MLLARLPRSNSRDEAHLCIAPIPGKTSPALSNRNIVAPCRLRNSRLFEYLGYRRPLAPVFLRRTSCFSSFFGYICLLIRTAHAAAFYRLAGLDHAHPAAPDAHPTHARRTPEEADLRSAPPRRQPRPHRQALRTTRMPLPYRRSQARWPLPHLQDRRQDTHHLRSP